PHRGAGGAGDLRRCLPAERGRAVGLQLRARRGAHAPSALRGSRARVPAAARSQAPAPCVRAGAEGLAHVQPARRAPRDLGDRAAALYPSGTHARERRRPCLSREPREARLPAPEGEAEEGGRGMKGRKAAKRPKPASRAAGKGAASARSAARPAGAQASRDFLFEIGTEELPPKALLGLEEALVEAIGAGLDKAGLAHGELVGFATPRRLAVWVKALAAEQPEQQLR